ncbi:MAG TPA: hypothetical protein VK821_13435 [Dehalococcoidia bacterium]|nr:hypothetical protein [Dehalococcoidia bacterium]
MPNHQAIGIVTADSGPRFVDTADTQAIPVAGKVAAAIAPFIRNRLNEFQAAEETTAILVCRRIGDLYRDLLRRVG